jgi:hypothetical protein
MNSVGFTTFFYNDIASSCIYAKNSNFAGYNERLVLPTSQLANGVSGDGFVNLDIMLWNSSGTLDAMYIGHGATSGNAYNFDGNQQQVTFNGATGFPINGPINITSDPILFLYNPTKKLIVSSHWSGTSITAFANPSPGPTGVSYYLSGASQANTSIPTGTWSNDNNWNFISNIIFNKLLGASSTITAVNLTSATPGTATSTYTTASISPGANKLDIVCVASGNSNPTNIPTVTGAGGTWVQIATYLDTSASRRITLFRDLSASPGSGALTIDFQGQVQNKQCQWSVDEFSGIDITGTHGSAAIVQSNTAGVNSGTSTGLTVNLAALGSAKNAVLGFVRNSTDSTLPVAGSGFTELTNLDDNNNTPIEAEWAINKTAIAWTWGSETTVSIGMAIEIRAAS